MQRGLGSITKGQESVITGVTSLAISFFCFVLPKMVRKRIMPLGIGNIELDAVLTPEIFPPGTV